jgi:hypothetical protein
MINRSHLRIRPTLLMCGNFGASSLLASTNVQILFVDCSDVGLSIRCLSTLVPICRVSVCLFLCLCLCLPLSQFVSLPASHVAHALAVCFSVSVCFSLSQFVSLPAPHAAHAVGCFCLCLCLCLSLSSSLCLPLMLMLIATTIHMVLAFRCLFGAG